MQNVLKQALPRAMVALLATACHAALAFAQPVDVEVKTRFAIDDSDPMAGVPTDADKNAHPLEFSYYLQELIERAEHSTRNGQHNAAARYYMAVATAVPERATGFSALCASLEAGGNRTQAIEACRGALGRQGAKLVDSVRLVRMLLGKPSALTTEDRNEVLAIVEHLKQDEATKVAAYDLECDVARKLAAKELLQTCTQALAQLAPGAPRTISLQWALALEQGDHAAALQWVNAARTSGMDAEAVHLMSQATSSMPPRWQRHLSDWRYLAAAFLTVAFGLLVLSAWRRRKTSAHISPSHA